jgi:hypothetical protein
MIQLTIIGFGMSTTCFILYLIDNHLIESFEKIYIIEKNSEICLNSLKYLNVNSNSTLKSMISVFQNDIFKDIISEIKQTYEIESYINLFTFNKILGRLCNELLKFLKNIKNIRLEFNYEVKNITENMDNYLINNIIYTKKILIATGGYQSLEYYKSKDIDKVLMNDKVILSKIIYNSNNLDFLENKNILIIGSSHSSISVIDAILKYNIKYKSIIIHSKNKIKVFYKNKDDCLNNNDIYEEDDLCTETGFINRYDGLRENSKQIFLNLHLYNNIELNNSYDNINFNEIDYIIPCWGYLKIIPKINNININNIFNIDSNSDFKLVLNEITYNNIYLLGLSSNPKIDVSQKSFNKSIDGIWLYYNIISKKIYDNIK